MTRSYAKDQANHDRSKVFKPKPIRTPRQRKSLPGQGFFFETGSPATMEEKPNHEAKSIALDYEGCTGKDFCRIGDNGPTYIALRKASTDWVELESLIPLTRFKFIGCEMRYLDLGELVDHIRETLTLSEHQARHLDTLSSAISLSTDHSLFIGQLDVVAVEKGCSELGAASIRNP